MTIGRSWVTCVSTCVIGLSTLAPTRVEAGPHDLLPTVSMIAVHELTFTAQLLRASTLQTGLIFGLVLALYFGLALVLSQAFRQLERRLRVPA